MILPIRLEGVGWSWIRAPTLRPFKDYWRTGFSHEPPVQRFLINAARRVIQDGERRPRVLDVGSRYGVFGVLAERIGGHVAVVESDARNVDRVKRRLDGGGDGLARVIHERVPFEGFGQAWRWADVVKIDVDGGEVDLFDAFDPVHGPSAVTIEIHRTVDRGWVVDLIGQFHELGFRSTMCTRHREREGFYEPLRGEMPEGEFHLGLQKR